MEENYKDSNCDRFSFRPISNGIGLGRLEAIVQEKVQAPNPIPVGKPIKYQRTTHQEKSSFDREKELSLARRSSLPWRYRLLAHVIDLMIVLPLGLFLLVGIGSLAYTERLFGMNRVFLWLMDRDASILILSLYGLFILYYMILKISLGRTIGFHLFRKHGRMPLPLP